MSKKKITKYTAIDLFSGCGGLSLGLKEAGFLVKAAVEIDHLAALTYRKNHVKTNLIESDIRQVSAKQLLIAAGLKRGELDLLAGCPPCQGFSRIKNLNKSNTDDPRNDLVFEFLRLIIQIRPKTVLMENVPGLSLDERFKKFKIDLEKNGYQSVGSVLNAANYGVPQRRKRFIFMASRIGTPELPNPDKKLKTVRSVIEHLPNPIKSSDSLHKLFLQNTPRIKKLISEIPKNGGSRSALKKQLPCHIRTDGFRDVYGRIKWDDVSPTLTGGCFNPSKGRYLHPAKNRPITMREASLLQSFPMKYYFPAYAGLINVSRLIGDAVPPIFAKRQAQKLYHHLATYVK
ncbi:MAG: putative BsuMI modification methylase subunit YdiO [Parcubacteria group bacterium ADurb.Bin115]|nr:MAG: putative BsuMI modification methylase subunit YdiO [Parcubacteria group bacterium ADurb.Bin115]